MSLGLGLNVRTGRRATPVTRRRDNRVGAGSLGVTATAAGASPRVTADREDDAERALEVLLDSALDPIVDMVLLARYGVRARSHDGWVRFRRTEGGVQIAGEAPIPSPINRRTGSPGWTPSAPIPTPVAASSYPFGFAQVAQLFDHPAAPDLCVIHSPPTTGRTRAGIAVSTDRSTWCRRRHRSSSPGRVRADGLVPRAGRLVDVAPTVAELLGLAPADDGSYVHGQDGEVRDDVLDLAGGRQRHVVGFLWDGTNPNVLY